ncbi:MAG: hypothetical protein AAF909_05165, partial [Pseudomonadota bacterium]
RIFDWGTHQAMRRIYRETPAGPIGDGSGLEHTPALMESFLQVLLLLQYGLFRVHSELYGSIKVIAYYDKELPDELQPVFANPAALRAVFVEAFGEEFAADYPGLNPWGLIDAFEAAGGIKMVQAERPFWRAAALEGPTSF